MPAPWKYVRVVIIVVTTLTAYNFGQTSAWSFAGQSDTGQWYQPNETKLTASSVRTLAPKWVFTTTSDV